MYSKKNKTDIACNLFCIANESIPDRYPRLTVCLDDIYETPVEFDVLPTSLLEQHSNNILDISANRIHFDKNNDITHEPVEVGAEILHKENLFFFHFRE